MRRERTCGDLPARITLFVLRPHPEDLLVVDTPDVETSVVDVAPRQGLGNGGSRGRYGWRVVPRRSRPFPTRFRPSSLNEHF